MNELIVGSFFFVLSGSGSLGKEVPGSTLAVLGKEFVQSLRDGPERISALSVAAGFALVGVCESLVGQLAQEVV